MAELTSISIVQNEEAEFQTEVSGTPRVTWYIDDAEVTSSSNVSTKSEGSVHTLTLRNCRRGSARIRVEAANRYGSSKEETILEVKGMKIFIKILAFTQQHQ